MTARRTAKASLAMVLGALSALLVSCGSVGKGLIPASDAGPLQSDFEAVVHAAEIADGNCSTTQTAIGKTEADLKKLTQAGVDAALRSRLQEGVEALRSRALALCQQPLPSSSSSTGTTTTGTTSTTTTTNTNTETSTTETTPTTPTETSTTETAPGQGGGTPAPEKGAGAPPVEQAEAEHGGGVGASPNGGNGQ
jgi:hypothetical protein